MALLAFAVIAFSGGWTGGKLVIDGPGSTMWVSIALKHWQATGHVPYWIGEMWAGTPAWALAPSLPVLWLLPLAAMVGPNDAVKIASLAAQVVAAWGVFVLARSFWRQSIWAPTAAGFMYGLSPLFISHTALFGHEPSAWAMAAAPWAIWSFTKALRGDGRHLGLASLLVGFLLLQQAEHAYALALFALVYVLVEVAARRRRAGSAGLGGPILRAGVIGGLAAGIAAYWLVPLVALRNAFVFTPPDRVRLYLAEGLAGQLAKRPEAFLTRTHLLPGTTMPEALDIFSSGAFYLGLVVLVLAGVGVLLTPRHDKDGRLSATLVASVLCIWMSTAAVPLARSGPATKGQLVAFLILGLFLGVITGSLLRRLRLGATMSIAAAGAILLIAAVPYLTPFTSLQKFVPFLANLRFPRFYVLAPIGLALAAAFPVNVVERWVANRQPKLAPAVAAALALAVIGGFVVDVNPYRSLYQLQQQPMRGVAYPEIAKRLAARGGDMRVDWAFFGDAEKVEALSRSGLPMAMGWPHPIASKGIWQLMAESWSAPSQYTLRALSLASVGYVVGEHGWGGANDTEVPGVGILKNPQAVPLVRTRGKVVIVQDQEIAPKLAVALAPLGIGVVRGDRAQVRSVESLTQGSVLSGVCTSGRAFLEGELAKQITPEVAQACAMGRWIGGFGTRATEKIEGSRSVGAVFRSPFDGLAGVAVWLESPPANTTLVLKEVEPDGRSLGREVARATSSAADDNGLWKFGFGPVSQSAGKQYAFLLSCPGCDPKTAPGLFSSMVPEGQGDLVVDGKADRKRAAAFYPLYPQQSPLAGETAQEASVPYSHSGPGTWRVDISAQAPTLVVVGESYFPGWKATLDGSPAPVVEADGAFLGVAVPAGQHRLELAYVRPMASLIGRIVTYLSLLAVAALLVVGALGRSRRFRRRLQGSGTPTRDTAVPSVRRPWRVTRGR
ncbi:MAG: YfhO family protein [Actinomycetota bacterium]